MRIVVCVKPSANGEIGPFDAAAYESALRIPGAEVILLSMAPAGAAELLERLTRLGAKEAYLLSDRVFAGSDTLATGYTLSLALQRLNPDMVFCGRKTVEGDTAQVGIGIAARMGYSLITRVMEISEVGETFVRCIDRLKNEKKVTYPALLTMERICELRLPSIRSRTGRVTIWDADDLGADPKCCGLKGSPTVVVKSFENRSGKRKCINVKPEDFDRVLRECLSSPTLTTQIVHDCREPLKNLWVFGEKATEMAETVSDDIRLFPFDTPKKIAQAIRDWKPSAVLWDSSDRGKELAASVAVLLNTGLCADCTMLETDGKTLWMYRPAFAGNVIAKIVCRTSPPMATVRTKTESAEIIFSIGAGAVTYKDEILRLARRYGAEITASRAAVDAGVMPYEQQVGLTGKTVAPKVYVAFGISGAVHHLAGIGGAEKIIAVNHDERAPIFEYADFGIVTDVRNVI